MRVGIEDADEIPDGVDWLTNVNPKSLELLTDCRVEPILANARVGERYQFERLGYFCVDSVDSTERRLVFNRTVTLRDSWANLQKAAKRSR